MILLSLLKFCFILTTSMCVVHFCSSQQLNKMLGVHLYFMANLMLRLIYFTEIPDRSFSAKNSINSIPSGLPQNSLLQHSNSLHRTGNQIHYNIPNLQTDRHHVELGHSEKPLYPAKDNVELGSGGVLPPMSIMRPPTCDGVICQNGGHCVVQGFQTKCNCPLGFGDKFCQKGIL